MLKLLTHLRPKEEIMARGDLLLFEEFANQLGGELHNFEASQDTFKVALINSTLAPTQAAAAVWGTWDSNEVGWSTANYTAGGAALTSQSYNEASGTATFDASDITWSQDASLSSSSNAYWAILYNTATSSPATQYAIAYIDLAGPIHLKDGDITISWNTSGIFTVAV
jgi:hypothetical protein